MHESLRQIPDRILSAAIGVLSQANTHAVYFDVGKDHWDYMSVINAAHAGELFIKAIIAKKHPLLIFKDLFVLDDASDELDINRLISKGTTYDFNKLPAVLWATTGERIPNVKSFKEIQALRNSVQHFCAEESVDFRRVALEFIYSNVDPLINKYFDLCAIEFHEDNTVGYDYVVSCLLRLEIRFSIPENFILTEIDPLEEIENASDDYKKWIQSYLK